MTRKLTLPAAGMLLLGLAACNPFEPAARAVGGLTGAAVGGVIAGTGAAIGAATSGVVSGVTGVATLPLKAL